MKKTLLFVCMLLLFSPVRAAIQGKEVSYIANGVTMKGYLAYDDQIKDKRPGVLVVHEWWGHNDYVRGRAKQLAEMGYVALAVDMYGDGKHADHPDDAKKFMSAVISQKGAAQARFEAAMKFMQKQKTVDANNLAAMGYCFGGGVVLNMARAGLPLKGVASYHGSLGTDVPAEAGKIKSQIRVFTGAEDPMIPSAQVDAFKQEMDKAGADYKVVVYPGVKHSFTNPAADDYAKRFGMPVGYHVEADRDSWMQTQRFLAEVFKAK